MTNNQWRTLFGAVAAVASFSLTQSDVVIPPILKFALGAILVGLAVINPQRADE